MPDLASSLFALAPDIRYVAEYRGGTLTMTSRPGLAGESSSESDKYEELVVNPTVTTLLTQRGDIDCGGLEYVAIRYGNFWAVVIPVTDGHVTVGMEPAADPVRLLPGIRAALGGPRPR